MKRLFLPFSFLLFPGLTFSAPEPSRGDRLLAEHFALETARLESRCLSEIKTLDDWNARKALYREELFEMLCLSPLPERGDLKATVTGKVEHEEFIVEKVHFQSLPGFYVTGNLYLPRTLEKPAPTVLYVCGHGPVVKNGISYGNKVSYQHHGAWFARNGYVCFLIDTVQMGEIQGIHHGTYREGMWWWNSRGYSSAGAEAWNVIRALDYLETRKEVDPDRFGITGRSGGGAYSWWGAALDERIKVAAPVAGITDLRNHVVDGTVEGHCDCMFIVNTYRWDYAQVAALVAPRPLLIVNTDKDSIFPLDGVMRVHSKVRKIYDLMNAEDHLGVLIAEGPHKDTQDLQVPVFRWFNKHLKGEDPLIEMAAVKFFEPEQLRVFEELPSDERTSTIYETFVPKAPVPSIPSVASEWRRLREGWMTALREKVFAGWPGERTSIKVKPDASPRLAGGMVAGSYEFMSQEAVPLSLWIVKREKVGRPNWVRIEVLDAEAWARWASLASAAFSGEKSYEDERGPALKHFEEALGEDEGAVAYVAPRGVGPTAWESGQRKQIQNRRRFMLLGQTLDGMRVWDIRRAVQAVRDVVGDSKLPVRLVGEGEMGCNALYASLFEKNVERLELRRLPKSHRVGPDYLNVLRFLDLPQAVAMAAERSAIVLRDAERDEWSFPAAARERLGWGNAFVLK